MGKKFTTDLCDSLLENLFNTNKIINNNNNTNNIINTNTNNNNTTTTINNNNDDNNNSNNSNNKQCIEKAKVTPKMWRVCGREGRDGSRITLVQRDRDPSYR